MNMIERVALAILVVSAVLLAVLGLLWREPDPELDPPMPAPEPDHRPRHADWGDTTRLRPPD